MFCKPLLSVVSSRGRERQNPLSAPCFLQGEGAPLPLFTLKGTLEGDWCKQSLNMMTGVELVDGYPEPEPELQERERAA